MEELHGYHLVLAFMKDMEFRVKQMAVREERGMLEINGAKVETPNNFK